METPSRISTVKDVLGIVREAAIIIVVAVVAIYPGILAYWAKALNEQSKGHGAKSTEVDVGIAKITFENATDQVVALSEAAKANAQVQNLAQQLLQTASPQNAQRAKEIAAASSSVDSKLQSSLASAKNVQLAQDRVIQDAPGMATGSGSYGIVVSADKKDDLAAYEVQQLKRRNFNVVIYDRQGFLRTVALFPDADAANQSLKTIQQYRDGAYLINVSRWCPTTTPERTLANVSVLKCQ